MSPRKKLEAGGVQLQAPGVLPELWGAAHGRDRRPPRRACAARATHPPVGRGCCCAMTIPPPSTSNPPTISSNSSATPSTTASPPAPNAGRKALTLRTVGPSPPPDNPCIARLSGFSLHAGTVCEAHERDSLERMCRYIARPAVSNERLSVNDRGQAVYRLKHSLLAFMSVGSKPRHLDRDSSALSALAPTTNPTTTAPILPQPWQSTFHSSRPGATCGTVKDESRDSGGILVGPPGLDVLRGMFAYRLDARRHITL